MRMGYPEAAAWDLAARGRSLTEISEALGAMLHMSTGQAQRRLMSMLDVWTSAALLEEVEGG